MIGFFSYSSSYPCYEMRMGLHIIGLFMLVLHLRSARSWIDLPFLTMAVHQVVEGQHEYSSGVAENTSMNGAGMRGFVPL